MTPDHQITVKRLRAWNGQSVGPLAHLAADAIEGLSAENDQLEHNAETEMWSRIAPTLGIEPNKMGFVETVKGTLLGLKSRLVATEAENARLRAAMTPDHQALAKEIDGAMALALIESRAENARLSMLADRLKAEIETLVEKFKVDTVALEAELAKALEINLEWVNKCAALTGEVARLKASVVAEQEREAAYIAECSKLTTANDRLRAALEECSSSMIGHVKPKDIAWTLLNAALRETAGAKEGP